MKLTRTLLLVLLTACSHTEPFPTGAVAAIGPNPVFTTQLTFNSGDDYAPSWTPDGTHIVYAYVNEDGSKVLAGSRCIAIIPALGGTRSFTLCDTRSTQVDSSSMFSATALRANGQLLFLQGVGRPLTSPVPRNITLWLADTAAPLGSRVQLAKFPRQIGDSVIEYLSDAEWIDPNTFLAVGNRLSYPCRGLTCTARDTVPIPIYMVRGTMAGSTVVLSQIQGTEKAARWARTSTGDILFVRGTVVAPAPVALETTIRWVPADGGAAGIFALSPNGAPIRGLTCEAQTCLVLTTLLYRLNVEAGTLVQITLGGSGNLSTWDSPVLSPDGLSLVYRVGRNLFTVPVPVP